VAATAATLVAVTAAILAGTVAVRPITADSQGSDCTGSGRGLRYRVRRFPFAVRTVQPHTRSVRPTKAGAKSYRGIPASWRGATLLGRC
jgi:hypothetical protein